MRTKPDWDLLIAADQGDADVNSWFPAKIRTVNEFTALEGMHFRNCYLTNRAIQQGSWVLFQILYRTAKITGGTVRHMSDFEEPA